ncbi:hypothetical protein [Levilactobacillus spicheri]|uniref:DUF2726 domain-containing protein n=2 Tax=Levilactobacillus spicheri TaxID=216463 RepID=A0ABQ0WLA6_9LACO|nr:hypothetical protein [Levilactobacillus spicheri]KRL49275.1 hypothetical protein FD37_GL000874 [Levilactobacillus spicheri DSM 15429]GEO65703.1 hypothetical protein LSP04_01220 [Levilactobacillus spicheri]
MGARISNEEFLCRIKKLRGDEYTFLEKYAGSGKKIKCRHNLCGFEYEITPNGFLNGSECRNCNKVTNEKFRERVFKLVGDEYTFIEEYKKASVKIMCRHNFCKYEYKVTPNHFYTGSRCPKCSKEAGTKKRANILRQSDEEFRKRMRNIVGDEYTFPNKFIGVMVKQTCIHNKCGYIWSVQPNKLFNGTRCPQCNRKKHGQNNESYQKQAKDIRPGFTVQSKYIGCQNLVTVKHDSCGTIWQVNPGQFLRGAQCPKCLSKKMSELMKLDPIEYSQDIKQLYGNEYTLLSDYMKATIKVKVRHNKCGYTWLVNAFTFRKGHGCPKCKRSTGEKAIEEFLINNNIRYEAQKRFNDCRNKSQLPFDFFIANKFLVEFDGQQHYKPIDFFGGESAFNKRKVNDEIKNKWAADNGIPLIRISFDEYKRINEIMSKLIEQYI